MKRALALLLLLVAMHGAGIYRQRYGLDTALGFTRQAEVQDLVDAFVAEQEVKFGGKPGDRWDDLDLVFCTPLGRPLDATAVSKEFHRVLDRAGLPPMRHALLRSPSPSSLVIPPSSVRGYGFAGPPDASPRGEAPQALRGVTSIRACG